MSRYCIYCGRELKEGERCSCRGQQQGSPPPKASRSRVKRVRSQFDWRALLSTLLDRCRTLFMTPERTVYWTTTARSWAAGLVIGIQTLLFTLWIARYFTHTKLGQVLLVQGRVLRANLGDLNQMLVFLVLLFLLYQVGLIVLTYLCLRLLKIQRNSLALCYRMTLPGNLYLLLGMVLSLPYIFGSGFFPAVFLGLSFSITPILNTLQYIRLFNLSRKRAIHLTLAIHFAVLILLSIVFDLHYSPVGFGMDATASF